MKIQNIQKNKNGRLRKNFDFLHSSKIKKNKMFYNLFFKSKFNFHFKKKVKQYFFRIINKFKDNQHF